MTDAFSKRIQLADEKKKQEAKDALLFAKSEAWTSGQRDFISSCEEQFKRKGYLSQKQIETLYAFDSAEKYDYNYDG